MLTPKLSPQAERESTILSYSQFAFEKTNVNVLDISQTILKDMFTMNMLVDVKDANVSFSELVDILDKEGERLGVSIRIQREDIFDAMHRI